MLGLLAWFAVSIAIAPVLPVPGWMSGILAIPIGLVSYLPFNFLASLFQTELPFYCRKVGGLARVYGTKNFDGDPDAFEKVSEHDAWDRFILLLREFSDYGGPITRETEFIGDARDWPAPR
ncbi:MAG TPA: hypothetical protein VKN76_11005 [Kiloniellaceae bacterium]|nr:hypothetical protein [Kiloniellaceae bacterium]